MKLKALLLDLDGTLLHTAPDMVGALNDLLISHNKPTVDYNIAMHQVSKGGAAMIKIGFGIDDTHSTFETLRQAFLDTYEKRVCNESHAFDGMLDVLNYCEANNIIWGIVTNKPEYLTTPILKILALEKRSAITVCGDTLSVNKPHPAPLLHCTTLLKLAPSNCLYVGDDERDIQAGSAAGMHTAVANWGYIEPSIDVNDWQPEFIIDKPSGLFQLLREYSSS